MKRLFAVAFAIFVSQVFAISCSEYELADSRIINEPKVLAIKVEPVVACPGCDITVSVFAQDGYSKAVPFRIKTGNMILESGSKNEFVLSIPKDISELYGNLAAKEYRANGYVDVPVEVEMDDSSNKTLKFFRIASDSYEKGPFDENPAFNRVTYEVQGSGQVVDVYNFSTVIFSPGYLSGEVTFEAKEIEAKDLSLREYEFEWFVSGSSDDIPELIELNRNTGKAIFLFKDHSGLPSTGKFSFTLIMKPKKAYTGTASARYGTDFHTFVFDTTGPPIDTEN